MFQKMSPDYQRSLAITLESLKPKVIQLHLDLNKLFPDAIINSSFREKSLDRAAQKDVNDYAGPNSTRSQVSDLFAARIFPSEVVSDGNGSDYDWKREYVNKILAFYQNNTDIIVKVNNKGKDIGGKDIKIQYVIFNDHIELQILSKEENDILNQAHAQYEVDRENTVSCCK
jgi:hypothetical protein